MSERADRGITVTEMAAMGQPIDVSTETTAAFVGRALRGPLNEPVLVENFGDYRRRFGDIWSRSSLGPAVRQFFEHGGRRLYVVRVANAARGALIRLPAADTPLLLRATQPGSAERIRAAVDFDGIVDDARFNLTLQRIDPATGHVLDQEIYRRTSCDDSAERYLPDQLATSSIASAEAPLPQQRPLPTAGSDLPHNVSYAGQTEDGSNGVELSDYDLVGSLADETGLFALQQVEQFDLMYLPPPGKGRNPGPASTLAAERYCRQRGAMLIVDPATAWSDAAAAIAGVREQGIASANVVTYFPRMQRRGDTGSGQRAVGGALAGLLCKLDRVAGCWHGLDQPGLEFSRELKPDIDIDEQQATALVRAGINVIATRRAGRAGLAGSVTLSRGRETQLPFLRLPVQRLHLRIVSAIDRGTRWAVFEAHPERVAASVTGQVTACLAALADAGALASERFFVDCVPASPGPGGESCGFAIRLACHMQGSPVPVAFTIQQSVRGCRVLQTAFGGGFEHLG